MVKNGLEKSIFNSLHAGRWTICVPEFMIFGENLPVYEVRENNFPQGSIYKEMVILGTDSIFTKFDC